MDELESLAHALRTERPVITDERLSRQRRRLVEAGRTSLWGAGARAWSWGLGVALGAVALVAIALMVRTKADAVATAPSAAIVPAAPLEQALADGTRVRLDPAARGALTRQAPNLVQFELTRGRAEFDVARDSNRTFRVVAGDYEVVVLGTRFSVAYGPGDRLAVAVERGAVSVGVAGREPIRLSAGERVALEGRRVVDGSEAPHEPGPVAAPAPPDPPLERSVEKPSSASQLAGWRRLYAERQYGAALEAARRAGIDHLVGTLGPRQLIELSDVARLGGDAALALRILGALERRFPNTAASAEASFLTGRLLLQSGRRAEATAAFERYLQRSGRGVYTSEALGRLMELYAHRGDSAKARATAERYLSLAPNGPYRRLARSLTSGR